MDLGGEPSDSKWIFHKVTGSDVSFQSISKEFPDQTIANSIRSMIKGENLDNIFWP